MVGLRDERPGLVVTRPRAHPPRSNPFLRSSSDAPPFPCITPSTVTWLMVVSFMIAIPSPWPPLVGGLTPATKTAAPIRHHLPDFFEELPGTTVVSDPAAQSRGDSAGRRAPRVVA